MLGHESEHEAPPEMTRARPDWVASRTDAESTRVVYYTSRKTEIREVRQDEIVLEVS